RGSFKNWTVLLAVSTFSLSLLGTFLVRSGVLTSVHAFASDPTRGIFILVFLVAVIGASLALFVWRAPKMGLGGRFQLFSRESLLLSNNLLLVVAAGTVLLGTLYPLIVDALGVGKISVGPPYFNAVFAPIMMPLLFLIGVGPFARWKAASFAEILRLTRWALGVAVLTALTLPFHYGDWTPLAGLGVFLAAWIFLAAVLHFLRQARLTQGGGSLLASVFKQPLHFWGMHLAHIGVAVFVAGVTIVGAYEAEKGVKMAPGDTVGIGDYRVRFLGVQSVEGPNYQALRGEMELSRNDRFQRRLFPEKRFYHRSAMPMTEAAIDAGVWRDVYVALGEPMDRARPDGEWVVRVYVKPLVDWIWGGAFLMALGGLLALLDRRYRHRRAEIQENTT
ncbi:MAG: c-type cytochrome biogenesis protein CcmF, partial [Zoogloeaceae bacterium]|nr:c-type cytochrome biogenesis protein CcmF [Zoogloeaceae bacterium]